MNGERQRKGTRSEKKKARAKEEGVATQQPAITGELTAAPSCLYLLAAGIKEERDVVDCTS